MLLNDNKIVPKELFVIFCQWLMYCWVFSASSMYR